MRPAAKDPTSRSVPANGAISRRRPAFYALAPGGWRDYVTLFHPPYTVWHLSYVVFGAALSPALHYDRLAATLLAFFLALGIGAHALDELASRPLSTQIPQRVLMSLGAFGLGAAVVIGIVGAIVVSPSLLLFIVFGAFIAPAYNLEWFGARLHNDFWFALAWGAFPFLTAYYASAERLELSAVFGAAGVFALSLAQRALSTRVRAVRRHTRSIEGRRLEADGTVRDIDRRWALAADERALMMLSLAVPALAVAALLSQV